MKINITMSEYDFEGLCSSSMKFGEKWRDQDDRFEATHSGPPDDVWYGWEMIYWVGESWANVIFARSYLEALYKGFEIIYDSGCQEYAILTDYRTDSWNKHWED